MWQKEAVKETQEKKKDDQNSVFSSVQKHILNIIKPFELSYLQLSTHNGTLLGLFSTDLAG